MVIELLEEILPHVENSIYPFRKPISQWKMKEGDIAGASSRSFNDKSWPVFQVPATWGKNDRTFWFRQSVTIPPEWSGKPVVLLLDFPEALLYVDGEPYQGIDANHDEVLLTPKARTNQSFLLSLEAYSGRKNDLNRFHRSEIGVVDSNARALFNSLTILHDLDTLVDHGSQESKAIRELIRRTLVFLKYFRPGSEEYPNAIARAFQFLVNAINTEPQQTLAGLVHLVGQSHLDLAWLWTLHETRKKCGRTFSTALRLMEEYPDFKFAQSQPVLYEFTKQDYPILYKQIKQRVAEGRWEPVGALWVEPDCNIPNGESLVRQILYGKRFFKSEFAIDTDVLWLPDTFGFGWALPQILQKSGITAFFTTKLAWNDTNRFPHNTFWWQGIDGTKILAHQPPVGLEGSISPKDISKTWEDFREKELNVTHVMQTYGYGDGGGGPSKKQIEVSRILKNNSGIPSTTLSSVREFFQQAFTQSKDIPVWKSELYLEKHRGTLTTHGWIKRANRRAERSLYEAELFAVLAMVNGSSPRSRVYPHHQLEQTWKILLLNQFHDIVTGTSIPDVYTKARTDFSEIAKTTSTLINHSLSGLTKSSAKSKREFTFTFFNTLGWERSEYVEVEVASAAKYFSITNNEGNPVEFQVINRGKGIARLLCYVERIAPYSFQSLTVKPEEQAVPVSKPWEVSAKSIESPLFKLRFDGKGFLSSVYDKKMRKELIERGKRGNAFQGFKDTPKQWDAWDIDADFERQRVDLFGLKKHQVIEVGPLRSITRTVYGTANGSELTQDLVLYHKRSQLVFNTWLKWKEKQTLLKVAFAVNVKAGFATYETQFGAIERSSKHKTDIEKAQFEVPAQQWADISDAKFGASLLNDSKYGYDAKDTTLRLTLVRSPFYPHPIEPWRLNDVKHTDQGEHEFSYALAPHAGNWKQGESTKQAKEFNNPLLVLPNAIGNQAKPFLVLNKKNIFVSSVKKAEDSDDIVIRLYEGHGEGVDTVMTVGFKPKAATECDLMERDLKPLKLGKDKLQMKFKPYEIKTVKFVLKGGGKK